MLQRTPTGVGPPSNNGRALRLGARHWLTVTATPRTTPATRTGWPRQLVLPLKYFAGRFALDELLWNRRERLLCLSG
jgi:hypothetical protein